MEREPANDPGRIDPAPGYSLSGRVAIVTGAGSEGGIGFAIARALGGLGAALVVASTTGRIEHRADELRRAGHRALGIAGDLTDPARATALVDAAVTEFGGVDVLVNNAGMTSVSNPQPTSSLAEMTDAEWQSAIDRNLTTAFNVTRAALGSMTDAGFGRIVNVASTSGPVNAYPGDVGYHAAKAGMVGMTRALAVEVAALGITVNAVAPGWIGTPSASGWEIAMGDATPLGRSGRPDEVAAAVAGFALPAASYTTGQVLVVDGANSIEEGRRT